jgi:hypothetical protein
MAAQGQPPFRVTRTTHPRHLIRALSAVASMLAQSNRMVGRRGMFQSRVPRMDNAAAGAYRQEYAARRSDRTYAFLLTWTTVRWCGCCNGGRSVIGCPQARAQHPDSIPELCMIAQASVCLLVGKFPVLPRCNLAPTSTASAVGRRAPQLAVFSRCLSHV